MYEKTACPKCSTSGRGTSFVIYDDGGYCMECGYKEKRETKVEKKTDNKPKVPLVERYGSRDIKDRNITKATCERFGYAKAFFNGSVRGKDGLRTLDGEAVEVANYYDNNRQVIAQKIRTSKKEFSLTGNGSGLGLYGRWLWKPSQDKRLTIVEGELDCLAVSQVMGSDFPVVSLPSGSAGAASVIKRDLEWLIQWGGINLGFDNDEAGIAAMDKVSELLDPSTTMRINWHDKDACDSLIASKDGDIVKAINTAQVQMPESLVKAEDILEAILAKPEIGLTWPWQSLNPLTYGIHSKHIYTLGAGSGVGKTTTVLSITGHLVTEHKQQVGLMYLETPTENVYKQLAGWYLKKPIHLPDVEYTDEEVLGAVKLFNDDVICYDAPKEGGAGSSWEKVKSKMIYMVKVLGVKFIVLDHLTALAAHTTEERKEIDRIMSDLYILVNSLDFTLFLVSHLAKPKDDGPTYEDGRRVTPAAFRGSQAIMNWSHFMIGLERNRMSEDEVTQKLTTFRVIKDRFSGRADGKKILLKYENARMVQCGV